MDFLVVVEFSQVIHYPFLTDPIYSTRLVTNLAPVFHRQDMYCVDLLKSCVPDRSSFC